MYIHKCSKFIRLKWIQNLCNQFIVDINCIISIINIYTTDQQNTMQISTSLVQIIPWLKSHWKLERYSIQCPFGNTCTDIDILLWKYKMFPLFNIHTKLSLVILCIGIITDFINYKRKHSASSWLQFSSVSSPLNRVMYTLTDQYHGVTQRRKQAHIIIHMY